MILAFDTYYFDTKAKTVCLSFETWTDAKPKQLVSEIIEGVAAYESGEFYKRELPCILSLLNRFDLDAIEFIIVDGYAVLNNEGKLGLGGHLFETLNKKTPIIGVAKSRFNGNNRYSRELFRGKSKNPLYISAKGVALDLAFNLIQSMHGDYRIPTLLQILDSKTKEKAGTNLNSIKTQK
ncbi:endonuclease V [Winogradskyella sp.]|uniref:endonuclease V n=1 Tax=Winogradskyella sp. TaxID=1883156 RepID=UPI003BABEB9A